MSAELTSAKAVAAAPPQAAARGLSMRQREALAGYLFIFPDALGLLVFVFTPMVVALGMGFFDVNGFGQFNFVGLANYTEIFKAPQIRRALVNNAVWAVVAPSLVTALGLILAVLLERVRRATAFKILLFMPMAISFLAAGVTFRLVYDESPDRGVLNAIVVSAHDAFSPPSKYHGARPRDGQTLVAAGGGYQLRAPATAGQPVLVPLVGLAPDRIPEDATPAASAGAGTGISGVVWLDFARGGGGTAGAVDTGERGLPDMTVQALRDGRVMATTRTGPDGRFAFTYLTGGGYTIRLPAGNFTEPFRGITWLGPGLVTPSIIGAYIWIWAGFAMILISAGLAAIPREALEAARVDGATEWQVFRRVTIPLVRPVLVVVMVTLIINVLKIFDLVFVLAPESTQGNATVVALEMWRDSFNNVGLSSALGVLLLLFVLPPMLINIRRLRREHL